MQRGKRKAAKPPMEPWSPEAQKAINRLGRAALSGLLEFVGISISSETLAEMREGVMCYFESGDLTEEQIKGARYVSDEFAPRKRRAE